MLVRILANGADRNHKNNKSDVTKYTKEICANPLKHLIQILTTLVNFMCLALNYKSVSGGLQSVNCSVWILNQLYAVQFIFSGGESQRLVTEKATCKI